MTLARQRVKQDKEFVIVHNDVHLMAIQYHYYMIYHMFTPTGPLFWAELSNSSSSDHRHYLATTRIMSIIIIKGATLMALSPKMNFRYHKSLHTNLNRVTTQSRGRELPSFRVVFKFHSYQYYQKLWTSDQSRGYLVIAHHYRQKL